MHENPCQVRLQIIQVRQSEAYFARYVKHNVQENTKSSVNTGFLSFQSSAPAGVESCHLQLDSNHSSSQMQHPHLTKQPKVANMRLHQIKACSSPIIQTLHDITLSILRKTLQAVADTAIFNLMTQHSQSHAWPLFLNYEPSGNSTKASFLSSIIFQLQIQVQVSVKIPVREFL